MYTYIRPVEESGNGFTGYMVDEVSTIKSFDHTAIYRSRQFQEAMNYFDTQDDMTRNILLSVNEADQNVVMTSLSNKLYQHIVDKVDDIDFGTIPLSKGDITKIDNYENLTDCINIITEVLQNYHQDTKPVETITIALQNMIDRTELFTKAYKLNVEMPMIIYNTIALAIVSSVSLMITSCIEFIKLPGDQGFDIALDKAAAAKTKDNVLFKDLDKFNRMCSNGDFDKAMDYVMKMNASQFSGMGFAFGASSVVVMLGLILLIIPVIRELIFFFYYSRTKVSDYFDAQASLLTINAYNIEHSLTSDEKDRKEIANKQKSIAEKFKKISNALKVNTKVGESKAEKEITTLDKQKYKSDEVLDRIPDSANATLF
jgi:hypothetical protein